MPGRRERKRRPDLDERFTLHPLSPEEVLRRLLRGKSNGKPSEDAETEQEESEPTSEP